MAGGLARSGVTARFAGLITTPGLAHVARTGPFAAGVMISASHNPYQDNGIKIIDHSGFKLPDEQEHALEQGIFAFAETGEPAVAEAVDDAMRAWIANTRPSGRDAAARIGGIRIVVDAAHGAATSSGARAVRRVWGQTVDRIGCAPDGKNINLNCGSLHLEGLAGAGARNRRAIWESPSMATPIAPCSFRTPERSSMAMR